MAPTDRPGASALSTPALSPLAAAPGQAAGLRMVGIVAGLLLAGGAILLLLSLQPVGTAGGAAPRLLTLTACGVAALALPPAAGWWLWVASTCTQGVESPLVPGVSWNILGLLAFWGAMAGWVLRGCPRPTQATAERAIAWPSNPAGFLLLALWLYLLVAAAQGLGLHRAEATASLRQVLVLLPTVVVGVGWFAAQGQVGQRHLMRGMALMGGALGGLGVAEFVLRRDLLVPGVDTAGGMFRINGVAPNPIVYGLHLAWSLPFAFGMIASERRAAWRTTGLLCLAAILIAGFLTLNRQTWVVMAATSMGALVLLRGRWIAWMALGGALAVLAAAPIVAPKVIARFAIMADLHYDTSFKYRRDNFRVAANILEHHPVTGLGLGQYPHNWHRYLLPDLFYLQYERPERAFYIDMGYMQVAAEAGLLGLGLLLLLHAAAATRLLACWSRAPAPQRTWWAVLLLALGVVLLSSLTQDTLLRPRLWMAWSLACCYAASAAPPLTQDAGENT